MPKPDEEHWLKIAFDFFTRFQFPLCLGAIDGKHIRIKKPNKSGSKYFNYKHFFSIILLAVTDANGKFVVVDVGSCGGNSDGGVFSRSSLGKKLISNKLSIPQRGYIPGTDIELPYMFVADEAFPLRENIMKPFPHCQLAAEKEIFNYRLSRARNSVECSFGRLAQMWRILFRQIDEQPIAATNIVKAITVLHNFVLVNEPHRLIVDIPEAPVPNEHLLPRRLTYQNIQNQRQRSTKCGMQVREKLVNYFMTEGAVPWQSNTL
jgi:DDE superfamily endonuclease